MQSDSFDLTIRDGTLSNDRRTGSADIGVTNGVIAALGSNFAPGVATSTPAAASSCRAASTAIAISSRLSGMGMMCADDFYSATVSAAFGGTTTILRSPPSIAARRCASSWTTIASAREQGGDRLRLPSDPDRSRRDRRWASDLPALIRDGIHVVQGLHDLRRLKLDDYQMLDVLALAGEEGALVMVHAENHDMIRWLAHHLRRARPRRAQVPCHRARRARRSRSDQPRDLAVAPCRRAAADRARVGRSRRSRRCAQAQKKGAADLRGDLPAIYLSHGRRHGQARRRGRDVLLQPAAARRRAQEAVWDGLKDGTFQTFSSDHAPYQFNDGGKMPKGDKTTFKEMANGVPGIELRLPLLFSEGVAEGPHHPAAVRGAGARPITRASTASIRARARSPSAPTPISRSGMPTRT